MGKEFNRIEVEVVQFGIRYKVLKDLVSKPSYLVLWLNGASNGNIFPGQIFVPAPSIAANPAELKPTPPALGESFVVVDAEQASGCHYWRHGRDFIEDCKTKGVKRARRLYWAGVLRSIGPSALEVAKKSGILGCLILHGSSKACRRLACCESGSTARASYFRALMGMTSPCRPSIAAAICPPMMSAARCIGSASRWL